MGGNNEELGGGEEQLSTEELERRLDALERSHNMVEEFAARRKVLKLLTAGAGGLAIGYLIRSFEAGSTEEKLQKCVGLLRNGIQQEVEVVCVETPNNTGGKDTICAPRNVIRKMIERFRSGGSCGDDDENGGSRSKDDTI